jgi:hypothetical protein
VGGVDSNARVKGMILRKKVRKSMAKGGGISFVGGAFNWIE